LSKAYASAVPRFYSSSVSTSTIRSNPSRNYILIDLESKEGTQMFKVWISISYWFVLATFQLEVTDT
jgi:hypothetical protein